MVQAKDFLLDSDDDLVIKDGDFVVDFSDQQHQQHIISSYKGYWRESLLCGVGILDYLNSSGTATEIKRLISLQLEADSYKVNSVTVTESPTFSIEVDAERIK